MLKLKYAKESVECACLASVLCVCEKKTMEKREKRERRRRDTQKVGGKCGIVSIAASTSFKKETVLKAQRHIAHA